MGLRQTNIDGVTSVGGDPLARDVQTRLAHIEAGISALTLKMEKIDAKLATKPDEGRVLFITAMMFALVFASIGLVAGIVAVTR
jgi:hypothetical protein